MLGLSCGENTALNDGMNSENLFSTSMICFAFPRWNFVGNSGSFSGKAEAINVISEPSALPRVNESP